jgi:hypothetical protein
MDPKDRAARRDRLRARAVTTTVVATVVAAPVLALWAAYRGTPTADSDGRSPTASEARGPDAIDGDGSGGYQNAGNASTRPGSRLTEGDKPDVSVEVISVPGLGDKGAGRLSVTAGHSGDTTLITLTAAEGGDGPVRWSATTGAAWLYLSRTTGTLQPGESITLKVYVDHLREPAGDWHARVAVSPAGAVVSIEGYGVAPTPSDPDPTPSGPPPSSDPEPTPTASPSTDPTPSDAPTSSDPEPTPTDPSPSDPGGSTAPSDGSGDPSPSTS